MKRYVGTGYTVYAHTNKTNFKTYFGQTKCEDLTKRWAGGNGYKGCPHFYAAIKKYGWDGFTHEIIQTGLTKEQADEIERENIWFFRTNEPEFGYNIQSGGRSAGGMSDEGKQSLIEHNTGENSPRKRPVCVFNSNGEKIGEFPLLAYAAEHYSIPRATVNQHVRKGKGTCHGMMFRYKDEVGDILKLPTDEVYKPNEKRNSKQRKTSVVVFDMSGNRVAEFPSVKGAAQSLGLLRSSISAVLSGAQKTCGNFIFKRSIDVIGCSVLDGDSVSMALSKPSAAKQILCYDLDGVYLRTYSSITEAENQLGISMKAISACLSGNSITSGGFQWRYATDDCALNIGKARVRGELKRETGGSTARKVEQFCIETGETISTFVSTRAAARAVGRDKSNIAVVANGKGKSCAGYGWRWHDG